MKKNSFFFIILYIFLMTFFSSSLYSQEQKALKGLDECEKAAAFLKSQNIKITEQNILYSEYNEYPFNIIIDFPASGTGAASKKTESDEINTIIFQFQIEDFFDHQDFFSRFIYRIKNAERKTAVRIIFTAGNRQSSPEKTMLTGTRAYTDSIDEDNCCALCISFTGGTCFILPGADRILSPTWIIKSLSESFYQNGFNYNLKGTFSKSLYKLNILKYDQNLADFLNSGIPSCGIELNDSEEEQTECFLKSAVSFCQDFDGQIRENWDTHGLYIQLGNRLYVLNENFTVIVLLIVACISLFLLCEFSFIRGKHQIRSIAKDVKSLWIQVPAAVIGTTAALLLGQGLGYLLFKIFKAGTILRLVLKMLLALGIVCMVYLLTFRLQKVFNTDAYSYLLTIASLLNVFIFSAVDISLVYIFAIEYIIVYISRPFKTAGTLSVFFLLMLIPFFPYIFQAAAYADAKLLDSFFSGSISVNFFLALILTPFEIQLLRIFFEINKKFAGADESARKFYRQNINAILIALAICAVIVAAVAIILPKPAKNKRKFEEYSFTEEEKKSLITWKDEIYFDETERIVTVNLPENTENLRIVITGKDKNSVLYSDDSYFSDKAKKQDTFIVPAWPGKKLSFCYIPETSQESEVYIKAYFPVPDSIDYRYFEYSLKIPAVNEAAE